MDYYYLTSPHQEHGFGLTPNVSNIAIRDWWSKVEATEGTFDWSAVDAGIVALNGAGKFSLSVSAGKNTPAWVYAAGAVAFNYTNGGAHYMMPLPWDSVFLAKWQNLIDSMADKYASNAQLDRICVGIQSMDQETSLPRSAQDQANWKAAGYSTTLIESAFKSMMSYLHLKFPNKKLVVHYVPGGMPFNPPDEGISLMKIGTGGMPVLFTTQNNGLSHSWIDTDILNVGAAQWGYQMIGAVGSNVTTAAALAASKGASYVEVYPTDVQYL